MSWQRAAGAVEASTAGGLKDVEEVSRDGGAAFASENTGLFGWEHEARENAAEPKGSECGGFIHGSLTEALRADHAVMLAVRSVLTGPVPM